MKKINALIVFVCMMFIITPVSAKEINHFYTDNDDDITLNETINASAAVIGTKVNSNATVNGIFFAAGNDVDLSGKVDYAVVAGNTVNIKGKILKDAAIAGNVINIKKAEFMRDSVFVGSNITVEGIFDRNVTMTSSVVEIDNTTVSGNLKLYADDIKIGDNVKITGTLSYPEDATIEISKSAVIGKTKKTEAMNSDVSFTEEISQTIMSYLSLILIFALISLFIPKIFGKIDEKYKQMNFEKGIEVFTKGLVILILIPIIAIILMVTRIGMSLAVILLLIYGIAIYLAKIFTAYLIGSKVADKWMKPDTSILVKGLIGIAIIFIISLVPYLNIFAVPFILLIGLGLIFDVIKK